jgi:membrane protease YdiL (CAAX protease family)
MRAKRAEEPKNLLEENSVCGFTQLMIKKDRKSKGCKPAMNEIRSYLRDIEKRTATVSLVSLVLMVIWLYQGHGHFFLFHFGRYFPDDPFLDWYQYLWMHGMAFLLWFILPLIIIRFWLAERARDYGLILGDWRFGWKFLVLFFLVMVVPVYFTATDPLIQSEYPLTKLAGKSRTHFMLWELTYVIYYIGFEFLFRGFILFGLKDRLGPFLAIMAQTVPSVIIHASMTVSIAGGIILIGKPEGETFAAILSGLVFGAVALRTRSILWGLLAHWSVGAMTDFFSLWHAGLWPS